MLSCSNGQTGAPSLLKSRPAKKSCSPTLACARAGPSRPETFVFQTFVEARDVVAIAVEKERGTPFASTDDFLGCLAPARMRHFRIDVGPEAVFGRLQRLPQTLRACVGKCKTHDRLDRFESVLPWHREAQWSAVLPRKRMAVGAGRKESQLVGRFRHGKAFDVR